MVNLPILEPQSAGLGTSAGDQQYVIGVFSFSIRQDPSEKAMCSRSMLSLHWLITSPSLVENVTQHWFPIALHLCILGERLTLAM